MRHHPSTSSGFVLVGVIMFVLALSILGMSLYAISGYEATFLGQSRDDYQALYSAQSGLELARERLAQSNWRLQNSHDMDGIEGVVRATAFQTHAGGVLDSTGPIDFSSDSAVTIVVAAQVGQSVRRVSAKFLPQASHDYYRRLFTVAGTPARTFTGPIPVPVLLTSVIVDLPLVTVRLGPHASIREAALVPTTELLATWTGPVDVAHEDSLPIPDVAGFYAGHPATLTPSSGTNAQGTVLTFNGHAAGSVGYYHSPQAPGGLFSHSEVTGLTMNISGTVVWELPAGLRVNNKTSVNAIGGPATLVMVGSRNMARAGVPNMDSEIGLWFFGGLDVANNVSVVLVSEGQVNIERNNTGATQPPVYANNLSVLCKTLFLGGGPIGTFAEFDYSPSMDAVIADLEAHDALPRTPGMGPQAFQFVAGTWRDLTP